MTQTQPCGEPDDDLGAIERSGVGPGNAPKRNRWPRTSRRQARMEAVLARRQPDLTVVLQDIHDPHNASAVLRSCDAVGISQVHMVYEREEPPARSFARTTSASAAKWIEMTQHPSMTDCYDVLRTEGKQILAMALVEDSVDLYDVDLTRPTAFIFGNEHRGLTRDAIAQSDQAVKIPMMGMVESLNISVSVAVSLYEAMRQRRAVRAYDQSSLGPVEFDTLLAEWLDR